MRRKDNAADYAYYEGFSREKMLDHLVAYSHAMHKMRTKIQELLLLCRCANR